MTCAVLNKDQKGPGENELFRLFLPIHSVNGEVDVTFCNVNVFCQMRAIVLMSINYGEQVKKRVHYL